MTESLASSTRAVFDALHRSARAEPYSPLEKRQAWLTSLREAILAAKPDLVTAADADFRGRAATDTLQMELFPALSVLHYCMKQLPRWMRPERCRVDWQFWFASDRVIHQPLGAVGIIAPWNYPFHLAIVPMINALAAGNRASYVRQIRRRALRK